MEDLENLEKFLTSIPTISKASAKKIAFFLISKPKTYLNELFETIKKATDNIFFCSSCNSLTTTPLCSICRDTTRDTNKLFIISNWQEINKIEDTKLYHGYYYIINSEIDARKKDTTLIELEVKKIINLINDRKINEITFGLNSTINGQITSKYIYKLLCQEDFKINFFQLAIGIPFNADIEYIDNESLKQSLENKVKI